MAISLVTRPPSNQQNYDAFWSRDPAFTQGDDAAHALKVARARETGDWSALLIAGASPTKFVMRQLTGTVQRRVIDQFNAGRVGGHEFDALLVRLAVVEVVELGDFKLKPAHDAHYGRIASEELIDVLDEMAPGAVAELSLQVFNRMMGVSGKS